MDISGIFPVLPTPFDAEGTPDEAALRRLVRYALASGVDGVTYPGVASEVSELAPDEANALGRSALERAVAAFMVAAPPDRKDVAQQIDFFSALGAALRVPIMLQNVPPPAGAGLAPDAVIGILQAVPAIAYVKEETLPSGQRLTALRERAPATMRGVFGGAGGRYVTDELRRGAAGSMPAIELAEVHAALMAAHRSGDAVGARRLFTRLLPVLNVQAVFRWALTKYVLQRRGLLAVARQRAAGPALDAADRADVDAFLDDIADLLLPGDTVP